MSQYKYAEIADTVYFWFAANATTGAADDGATPLYDVRFAGAAADAAPTASGTPTLLSHANYGAGLHEIAIDTTGHAAGEYAVFCTITVSTVNPGGFVGSYKLRTAGTAAIDVKAVSLGNDVITPASVDEDADFVIQALSITNALDAGSFAVDGALTVGDGIAVTCSTDSKSAIKATGGATAGNGMELIGTGTGIDLKADVTGNITGNVSGTVAGKTPAEIGDLGTVQTGDSYARIGAAGIGLTAITDAITALENISAAEVNTQVDSALNTAIPGAPTADSINQYIQQLKYVLVNQMAITEATGNVEIKKDDDAASAATVAAAFTTAAGVTTRKRLE